jgi:hypothetical protein
MSAMPLPARRPGSTVPTRLIPTGMAATDSPVTARPAIRAPMLLVKAQISEPARKVTSETTRISFLPYRSPSRPKTGTATAPVSSVAVSSHSVDVAEVCSSTASRGSTGTSNDKESDTMRPAAATSTRVTVDFAPAGWTPASGTSARPAAAAT